MLQVIVDKICYISGVAVVNYKVSSGSSGSDYKVSDFEVNSQFKCFR